MRVFVSCDDVDGALAKALLAELERLGLDSDCSPRPPVDEDPRWRDWYDGGCAHAIDRADVVVAIVTPGWTCSTWMSIEGDTALRLNKALFVWNPQLLAIPIGMQPYAVHQLPASAAAAAGELVARAG